jgi:hypothetical protein
MTSSFALGKLTLTLLFAFVSLALFTSVSRADIQLDNTCSHGSNYVQLAGFACIADEEKIRNPSWSGLWGIQGTYNINAFTLLNKNMNAKGIDIAGTKYCSNFTVCTK